MATKQVEMSQCGAVDLLAAIFCENRQLLRLKFGLPSRYTRCLNCGQPFLPEDDSNLFCSLKCRHEYLWIQRICCECGDLFYRVASQVIYKTEKKRQGMWFCSKKCQGKYLGKQWGFGSDHRHTASRREGREAGK